VICSGIGGMAEKVRHGVDGLHFEARNPTDLADVLTQAITTDGLWNKLAGNIRQPVSYRQCAEEYLRLVA
jgi:glycosyltransferase involved in cell wall biosynthesis